MTYPFVPESAALYSADLVGRAAQNGEDLDYSRASIERVDEIIAGFRDSGTVEQDVANTLLSFGFYLGESVIAAAGGHWVTSVGTPMEQFASFPLLVESGDGLNNPLGRPFKAFANGDSDSLISFYDEFTR